MYLFHCVFILWLGMPVYDLATLISSEHVTELQWASTQSSIFSLLVVCCALVTMTDMNTYAFEEYLIVSAGCIKLQHRSGNESGDDTFSFSSDLGSCLYAEQPFYHRKKCAFSFGNMKDYLWSGRPIMWMVTCATVATYTEHSLHSSIWKWLAEIGVLR